jgi:tetratricopeptide (TPR) repeat protein
VIQLDPTLAQAYGRRGLAYNALGNRSAAISDLQQAATLFQQQGDRVGYQQTLDLMNAIQR